MTTASAQVLPGPKVNFRFSGHETFACRYAWLPKAVTALEAKPTLFTDEDDAMVALGVGKNMVRAIRFWVDATHVAEQSKTAPGLEVTSLGHELLGKDGFDPYLEDVQTLWLVHWELSTSVDQPLFAWHYMLNYWHRPDFTRTEVLEVFQREADRLGKRLSLLNPRNTPSLLTTADANTLAVADLGTGEDDAVHFAV